MGMRVMAPSVRGASGRWARALIRRAQVEVPDDARDHADASCGGERDDHDEERIDGPAAISKADTHSSRGAIVLVGPLSKRSPSSGLGSKNQSASKHPDTTISQSAARTMSQPGVRRTRGIMR